jgi:4a-hydroxytetrahydrobiopterin dehydratase
MTDKLNDKQIETNLLTLNNWERDQDAIKKEWIFKDFLASMDFLNKVARIAEKHNHHPEIFNVYNKVSLRYSTHDAGSLTELDFIVAKEIDQIDIS